MKIQYGFRNVCVIVVFLVLLTLLVFNVKLTICCGEDMSGATEAYVSDALANDMSGATEVYVSDIIAAGIITDCYGNVSGSMEYTIYADGTMIISGEGPGASYRPFGMDYAYMCPWNDYRNMIKRVVFHCTITGTTVPCIGGGGSLNGWFAYCDNLLEVYGIPDGITDMSATFYECNNLLYVDKIPESVKTIQYTFWNCKSLKISPKLPDGLSDDLLTEFPGHDPQVSQGLLGTFKGCAGLTAAPKIPQSDNLYKLVNTFEGCSKITVIKEIPENIKYFQASFKNCTSLKDVMYINSEEIILMDGVFENAAAGNPYLLFVKTRNRECSDRIMETIREGARVYVWEREFFVDFMVMNSVNQAEYGLEARTLHLRYGGTYEEGLEAEYAEYISANYDDKNIYSEEYGILSSFAVPEAAGYEFLGWYYEPECIHSVYEEDLINPDNRQLVQGRLTLYAKMQYTGSGCKLIIDPDGGVYQGHESITTITEFEDKSYERDFIYTGNYELYTIPVTGRYSFNLYGAQGGGYNGFKGGYGGMLSVTGNFEAGKSLYMNVGGGGQKSTHEGSTGGFNGGGNTVKQFLYWRYDDDLEEDVRYYDACAGGGGATDIRADNNDIASRIACAGGGGGAGAHNNWYCQSDNPEEPDIYYDDDDPYYVYERTIDSVNGQGGISAAGGGGGIRGGAHNYTGASKYGKVNSSYAGTNGYDNRYVTATAGGYHINGSDIVEEYGKNGSIHMTYHGKGYTPEEPYKKGCIFAGWYVTGDGTMLDNTVYMSEGTVFLKAKWIKTDYRINFDAMGGTVNKPWIRYWTGFRYGYHGGFPAAYKEGAIFKGWYTVPEGGELITETMIADRAESFTLYAQYEDVYVTAYFDAAGGSTEVLTKLVQTGKEYGVLPVPQKSGCRFTGWQLENNIITDKSIVYMKNDHVLKAGWKNAVPPVITGDNDTHGWRNTPLNISYVINAQDEDLLKDISVTVKEAGNEEKTVIYADISNMQLSMYKLEFTIGDIASKLYEGITEWSITAADMSGNVSIYNFTVKIDYTPPVIKWDGSEQYTVEKEYIDAAVIKQRAEDELSGVLRLYIVPASMQDAGAESKYAVCKYGEPYEIEYNSDDKALKNEAAYVVTAVDRAGNISRKLIFTSISVNNTVIRVVPEENYR